MTPIIKILRKKMEDGGFYSKEAIDALLNLKDRVMVIKNRKRNIRNTYKIRGTIFSGFWGTYLFNTIIVAT